MLTLCVVLWVAAGVYQLLSWVCLRRFLGRPVTLPGVQGVGVTVFKPVKGWDPGVRECLESFLTQKYAPYEVLFGVASPADPALEGVRELAARHPELPVQVVLCPLDLGMNPKVSILRQLAPRARYDVWVIADADVHVGEDFLSCAAAAARTTPGLVSCPYRAGAPRTLGSTLESLTIAGDFIPAVAVARYLEGVDFALGAVMVLTRQACEAIGGFAAVADYLADDYQLGHRIRRQGLPVDLMPYVVETRAPEMSLGEYVRHQLRWSRTYRVCRPRGYLAYGLTHMLAFALLVGWLGGWPAWAVGVLAGTVGLRLALTWDALRRCLGGSLPWPALALVPVKDLLAVVFWLLSFLGDRVSWRGRRFRLRPDGRLVPEGK